MNFKKLFEQSKTFPLEAKYKKRRIFVSDKFFVKNKDVLVISIEKTNSRYPQGVLIRILNGTCRVMGKKEKKKKQANVLFWEDTQVLDPKNIEIQVFTTENFMFIKNIWEAPSKRPYVFKDGDKHTCFAGTAEWYGTDRWNGAAMIAEEIVGGRRYRCNDGVPDDDFDDIIFTVRNVGNIYKAEDK